MPRKQNFPIYWYKILLIAFITWYINLFILVVRAWNRPKMLCNFALHISNFANFFTICNIVFEIVDKIILTFCGIYVGIYRFLFFSVGCSNLVFCNKICCTIRFLWFLNTLWLNRWDGARRADLSKNTKVIFWNLALGGVYRYVRRAAVSHSLFYGVRWLRARRQEGILVQDYAR